MPLGGQFGRVERTPGSGRCRRATGKPLLFKKRTSLPSIVWPTRNAAVGELRWRPPAVDVGIVPQIGGQRTGAEQCGNPFVERDRLDLADHDRPAPSGRRPSSDMKGLAAWI